MRIENKTFKGKTLQHQLLIMMSVCIIIPILFVILLFHSVKGIIIQKYSESAQQSVRIAAYNIDYLLEDITNITNSILTNHDTMDALKNNQGEDFLEKLKSFYVSSFYVEGIYVESENGYQYVGSNIVGGEDRFIKKELEFTSGEIVWFPTRKQTVQILTGKLDKSYFTLGRKMIDVNSLKELGYMNVAIDEYVLRQFYSTLMEPGTQVFICDEEGNVISNREKGFEFISKSEHAYLNSIFYSKHTGYVEYEEEGVPYVAIYSSLSQNDWRIIKTVPKKILYAEINKIQDMVLIGAFMVGIVMFLVSFVYSKMLTRPISKMIGQMAEVEAGNLNVTVDIQTNKEMCELGNSFNHMVQRIRHLVDEMVKSERNKNEMELEVLHAQINPHFLYNTLNTIRLMAKMKGEDNISDAVVALVKLLRVSINMGKSMIKVKDEISYVENYLLIQRLRFNQQFEIRYEIQNEAEEQYIPKLILQPIVENALIYCAGELEDRGETLLIRIHSRRLEDRFLIIVEDNGPGMEEDVLSNILKDEKDMDRFSTVGLNNVNQRVKLYFGDDYQIQIISEKEKGTKVIIPIPIKTEGGGTCIK